MVGVGTDVLIVGGGPAGLATALALRQRGADVVVADSMQPPIDKACGEGLLPDALQALAQLGVELTAADGATFRGVRFVERDTMVTGYFPACSKTGYETGIGLRRQTLHGRLVSYAEAAGVRLLWRSPVQLLDGERVLVRGETMRYRWLVGADGHNSRVRRWAGLERGRIASRRFGFRRHYRVEPWSPLVEVHWAASGQAYVTPTGPREVCVSAVVRQPSCRLDELLKEMPDLRARLGASALAGTLERERGAVTTTRSLDRVARGPIALVGDASGSADAVTGEGMGMAFRQAVLLAECLEAGDLSRYNRLHPRTQWLAQTMARTLLWMDRSPLLRQRAFTMLAAEPSLFTRMLAVHLGEESMAGFVTREGLGLGWRLAFPAASTSVRQTRMGGMLQ